MAIRGIAAGAVGTAVLNAVTYADMARSGRKASSAPADTVLAVADEFGISLPDDGGRPDAYGALAGAATGIGIGMAASAIRRGGIRVPLLAEAAIIGAGAMFATDAPMHWAGVSDVGEWTSADWAADAVPHFAYGLAVAATLRQLEKRESREVKRAAEAAPTRSRVSTVLRSLAVGAATGMRSSMGIVPSALGSGRTSAMVGAAGLVAAELTVDKLPAANERVEAMPFVLRLVFGGIGAAASTGGARPDDMGPLVPMIMGATGAAAGTLAGYAFRDWAAQRGWTWQAAVVEDGVALGLTALARH